MGSKLAMEESRVAIFPSGWTGTPFWGVPASQHLAHQNTVI